jgi:SAM-dependent methyltransferase
VLDYDVEAEHYDQSRGGIARAEAAARAVEQFLPAGAVLLLDVAAGTGIVTERLVRGGRSVLALDRSAGMLRHAVGRLPGRVLFAEAERLPIRSDAVDAVCLIWLLHLVTDAAPVLVECARVLRAGGVLVTTVDKAAAHDVGSDIDDLLTPYRAFRREAADASIRVIALAQGLGLHLCGQVSFTGHGQGRTPQTVIAALRVREYSWTEVMNDTQIGTLVHALERLPGQATPREDPVFKVIALRREGPPSSQA